MLLNYMWMTQCNTTHFLITSCSLYCSISSFNSLKVEQSWASWLSDFHLPASTYRFLFCSEIHCVLNCRSWSSLGFQTKCLKRLEFVTAPWVQAIWSNTKFCIKLSLLFPRSQLQWEELVSYSMLVFLILWDILKVLQFKLNGVYFFNPGYLQHSNYHVSQINYLLQCWLSMIQWFKQLSFWYLLGVILESFPFQPAITLSWWLPEN